MAYISIVVGESGSGKTTSVNTLNPKETAIVSVLGKRPTIKGSKKSYVDDKNFFYADNYLKVVEAMKKVDADKSIKNVIVDDVFFTMSEENFRRSKEAGYGKFADMGLHMQMILKQAWQMDESKKVFFMMHSQDVVSDQKIVKKEIKLVGKFVKEGFNPAALCDCIFYAKPRFNTDKTVTYGFHTHLFCDENGIEYICKSPEGMFSVDFIPNDLSLVIEAIDRFENGEDETDEMRAKYDLVKPVETVDTVSADDDLI